MDVFISYSRKDYLNADDTINNNSIIAQLLTILDNNGITYWIDKEGIYEKDNFAELIANKIVESSIFLFVSSKFSNESSWTSKEVAVAHEYEKQIIPFRIDESKFSPSVTFYLADIDQIRYYKNPSIGFDLLVKSIQDKLNAFKKTFDDKTRIIQIQEKIQALKETNTVTNTEIIKYESSLAGLIQAYNSNLEQIECFEKEIKALDSSYNPIDVSKDYKVSMVEQNKRLLSAITEKESQIKELERIICKRKPQKEKSEKHVQPIEPNVKDTFFNKIIRLRVPLLEIICLIIVLILGTITHTELIELLCICGTTLFFIFRKKGPKFKFILLCINVGLMMVSIILFFIKILPL